MIDMKYVSMKETCSHGYAINDRTEFSKTANLLFDIARTLALTAIVDGEDSSGRHKHRVMTVDEVLAKSVSLVDGLLKICSEREWSIEKGPVESLYKDEQNRTGF